MMMMMTRRRTNLAIGTEGSVDVGGEGSDLLHALGEVLHLFLHVDDVVFHLADRVSGADELVVVFIDKRLHPAVEFLCLCCLSTKNHQKHQHQYQRQHCKEEEEEEKGQTLHEGAVEFLELGEVVLADGLSKERLSLEDKGVDVTRVLVILVVSGGEVLSEQHLHAASSLARPSNGGRRRRRGRGSGERHGRGHGLGGSASVAHLSNQESKRMNGQRRWEVVCCVESWVDSLLDDNHKQQRRKDNGKSNEKKKV